MQTGLRRLVMSLNSVKYIGFDQYDKLLSKLSANFGYGDKLKKNESSSSPRTARRHVLHALCLSGDAPHAASCFPSHVIMA